MSPKGVYERTEANKPKPRQYPAEIISLAVGMYEAGSTVVEVQAALPKGYKAQRILERHLPSRRSSGKRDQRGPANHMWKPVPSYGAIHLRLGDANAHECVDCDEPARHWSYVGGCRTEHTSERGLAYCTHPHHYQARCVTCHHRHDHKGRRANGQFVSRQEVMPHV